MLHLKIVSPEKIVYEGDAIGVKVPGTLGSFEILDNHAPLISSLMTGKVEYTTTEGRTVINIQGGFVEIQKNEVRLCVEM